MLNVFFFKKKKKRNSEIVTIYFSLKSSVNFIFLWVYMNIYLKYQKYLLKKSNFWRSTLEPKVCTNGFFFFWLYVKLQHNMSFKANIACRSEQRVTFGGVYRMKFPRHWSSISHTFLYSILALTDELLLEILSTLLVSQNIFMYNSLSMFIFF